MLAWYFYEMVDDDMEWYVYSAQVVSLYNEAPFHIVSAPSSALFVELRDDDGARANDGGGV
jgi:hypothetical protein